MNLGAGPRTIERWRFIEASTVIACSQHKVKYMAFGPRYKARKIAIDTNGTSSKSSNVQERLDRIGRHYDELEAVFDDLESRIAMDDRLQQADTADEPRSRSTPYRPRQPR